MGTGRAARAILVAALAIIASTAHAAKAKLIGHREMLTRLGSLEAASDSVGYGRVRMMTIGYSVKGRSIVLVSLTDPTIAADQTRRIFIICRQHGDEPASTEAMISLIEELAFERDAQTADLLSKVSLYIVPMANPDGAERNQRRNARNVDLNRDWLKLTQPETICIRAAIRAIDPEVVIDQHELSPTNSRSDFVESVGPGCGVSSEVAYESAKLQKLIIGMLRTHDMTVRSSYIDDSRPARLAHRFFPIHRNIRTFLFETRQSGMRAYQLQYRMQLHIIGTMTIAKYLAGREDELKERIAQWESRRRTLILASRGKAKGKSSTRNPVGSGSRNR